jgi:arylsulfatase A
MTSVRAEYRFEDAAIRLTDKAVSFIEQHQAKPFFLYFAHRNIHAPLRPNERFKGTSEIGVYGDFITELDWSVGQVLSTLDRLNLSDNTLVFFSSDNGGVLAAKRIDHPEIKGHRINGPLRGQKTEAYEGGTREPFIVRWPGNVKAASQSDQLIALTDLLATFAELQHRRLPAGAGEDSFSFLSTLLGKPAERPMRQSLVTDSMMGTYAIQEGPWKYIAGQGGGGYYHQDKDPVPTHEANEPPGQLYNLADDIGESKNLYAEKPEVVGRLSALLDKIKNESIIPKEATRHPAPVGTAGDDQE